MAKHIEQVTQSIRQGRGLAVVHDESATDYVQAYAKADPRTTTDEPTAAGAGRSPAPRPVIVWDADDGFLTSDFPEELPSGNDLLFALESIRRYEGRAVFVVDCGATQLVEHAGQLRKTLRQLDLKLTGESGVTLVLVSAAPLPAALGDKLPCFGEVADEPPAAEQGAATVTQDVYREVRELARFDTPEWQQRLEAMSADEALALSRSDAYHASLNRVNELRRLLKEQFVRKDEIIDAICAAAVAQVPTVLIGPPGTAKSNIIRCFCEGLGLTAHSRGGAESNGSAGRNYFEYLLTRFTTPEEIFGPIHVQDLIDKQVYRRVTDGYLPEAQIAFLDEIFKASSAILNTLLTMLNERIFYNAGRAVRVPLMMVFAASNEAPTEEGLQALYDRFPLRLNCHSVENEHLDPLLSRAWGQAFDRQFAASQTALPVCSCTNDLWLLRHVMRVRFGGRNLERAAATGVNYHDEFLRFFRSLRGDYEISDRTMSHLFAFARAMALLNRHDEMTSAELDVFRYVAWDESGIGDLDRLINNMKRGIRI